MWRRQHTFFDLAVPEIILFIGTHLEGFPASQTSASLRSLHEVFMQEFKPLNKVTVDTAEVNAAKKDNTLILCDLFFKRYSFTILYLFIHNILWLFSPIIASYLCLASTEPFLLPKFSPFYLCIFLCMCDLLHLIRNACMNTVTIQLYKDNLLVAKP